MKINAIAAELEGIIDECFPKLKTLREDEFYYKPSPVKWSKKEIAGHLIDSAQNNIRRFVVAQYEENPLIRYNQDSWVSLNDYQHQPSEHIVQLWYLLNKQMVFILKNTSAEMAQNTCGGDPVRTIEWLALDYIKHLAHHLHQLLNLDPVAYP